jgi:hypothetical protein
MGFHYQDAASWRWQDRPLSAEASNSVAHHAEMIEGTDRAGLEDHGREALLGFGFTL